MLFRPNPSSRLLKAAKKGKLQNAKEALAKSALPDARNEWGETPLMLAAQRGHNEIVSLLIEKGADVNAKDNGGRSALIHAAQKNRVEAAKLLLENGASINQTDKFGNTPLIWSVLHKKLPMVEFLVAQGAHIGHENKYHHTAIDLARQLQFWDAMKALSTAQAKQPRKSSAEKPVEKKPRHYKASDSWTLLAPGKIAHVRVREETQEKLTDLFNFVTREKTSYRENLTTRLKTKGEPVSFDILDRDYLWNALNHFHGKHGKVDEDFALKGIVPKNQPWLAKPKTEPPAPKP
jgi:hypothetical protein